MIRKEGQTAGSRLSISAWLENDKSPIVDLLQSAPLSQHSRAQVMQRTAVPCHMVLGNQEIPGMYVRVINAHVISKSFDKSVKTDAKTSTTTPDTCITRTIPMPNYTRQSNGNATPDNFDEALIQ